MPSRGLGSGGAAEGEWRPLSDRVCRASHSVGRCTKTTPPRVHAGGFNRGMVCFARSWSASADEGGGTRPLPRREPLVEVHLGHLADQFAQGPDRLLQDRGGGRAGGEDA